MLGSDKNFLTQSLCIIYVILHQNVLHGKNSRVRGVIERPIRVCHTHSWYTYSNLSCVYSWIYMHSSPVNRSGVRNSLPHGADISIFRGRFPPYFSSPHLSALISSPLPNLSLLYSLSTVASCIPRLRWDSVEVSSWEWTKRFHVVISTCSYWSNLIQFIQCIGWSRRNNYL